MGEKEETGNSSWVQDVGGSDFSLREAVGGPRGVVEALLPGLAFVTSYVLTQNLWWTVGLSAGVSVLFVVVRLVQRQSAAQALGGLLGVAIGVVWAASSGRTENYYAWGILVNAAYGGALALSILIRQPLGAWIAQIAWALPPGWRRSPRYRLIYRRARAATAVWVGIFALRLAVQWPLYQLGDVTSLGVARLTMGLPLFALGVWLTWALMRNLKPSTPDPQEAPHVES